CDQHSSIGKERDCPRMRQASRQNRDLNLVLLRRIQYERACAQRRNRNTDSRFLRVAQRNGCGYQKCSTSGVTYHRIFLSVCRNKIVRSTSLHKANGCTEKEENRVFVNTAHIPRRRSIKLYG